MTQCKAGSLFVARVSSGNDQLADGVCNAKSSWVRIVDGGVDFGIDVFLRWWELGASRRVRTPALIGLEIT
jgi:hypothetical protein